MIDLLVKLIVSVALLQLGLTWWQLDNCHSRQCAQVIERKSRDILRINWKPISVFPEEVRRFK